jgi:hypothetical protein
MNYHEHYEASPANVMQLCRFWSAHVDALERRLSAKTWAVGTVAMVLIAYPIARFVIPTMLDSIVPHVVRTVLSLI